MHLLPLSTPSARPLPSASLAPQMQLYLHQLHDTCGSGGLPAGVVRVLNSKACRGAIMFGDALEQEEVTCACMAAASDWHGPDLRSSPHAWPPMLSHPPSCLAAVPDAAGGPQAHAAVLLLRPRPPHHSTAGGPGAAGAGGAHAAGGQGRGRRRPRQWRSGGREPGRAQGKAAASGAVRSGAACASLRHTLETVVITAS